MFSYHVSSFKGIPSASLSGTGCWVGGVAGNAQQLLSFAKMEKNTKGRSLFPLYQCGMKCVDEGSEEGRPQSKGALENVTAESQVSHHLHPCATLSAVGRSCVSMLVLIILASTVYLEFTIRKTGEKSLYRKSELLSNNQY